MNIQGRVEPHYLLPAEIAAFAGEINDTDGHECMPIGSWVDEFGSIMVPLRDACIKIMDVISEPGTEFVDGIPVPPKDDAPIDAQTVWNLKMESAPGGIDLARRLEVLDFMGVKRQLIYHGGAPSFSQALLSKADDPTVFSTITGDRKAYARKLIDACNDWCIRLSRSQDRLRPAAALVGDTPQELYDQLKKIVDGGVRQVVIAPDMPPAGLSPADPALDPVWALAADAGCAVLGHIAISENLLKTLVWRDAPAFKGFLVGAEFSLDPWTLSNVHLAVQNYLTTMILGGVFDRHPDLVFGTAEFTGHWVGPFAENMDMWYAKAPFRRNTGDHKLKMRPSDYVRCNVRVACFDIEPVGTYISRFGFEDVFCYASDFPHPEGGKDPIANFVRSLEGHPPEILRKFFVENGKKLLPD